MAATRDEPITTQKAREVASPQPSTTVSIIDASTLQERVYVIRGQQVMLDFDLAEIYGYSTTRFNEQVKRNQDKFEEDFMFTLTSSEMHMLSMSHNAISIQTKGKKGGRSKPIKAFTEQGIYMLMTVLHGPLAIQQSKALIRLFRAMKDCLAQRSRSELDAMVALSEQTNSNTEAIFRLQTDVREQAKTTASIVAGLAHTNERLEAHGNAIAEAGRNAQKASEELAKTDLALSTFMASFGKAPFSGEFVILQGKTLEASAAYQKIYGKARHTIVVIDNYVGLKTLLHLRHAPEGTSVYLFSDNLGKGITAQDMADFQKEFPQVHLELRAAGGAFHDRFVVLDLGFGSQRIFLCGASSKDAGRKVSVIVELSTTDPLVPLVETLFSNPPLELR